MYFLVFVYLIIIILVFNDLQIFILQYLPARILLTCPISVLLSSWIINHIIIEFCPVVRIQYVSMIEIDR